MYLTVRWLVIWAIRWVASYAVIILIWDHWQRPPFAAFFYEPLERLGNWYVTPFIFAGIAALAWTRTIDPAAAKVKV